MRSIGLHIRLDGSLVAGAQKALRLGLSTFQCFFVSQHTNRLMRFEKSEVEEFLATYREKFTSLYLHGSYWINLAGVNNNGYRAFRRERDLAKRLEFTHMILHSGSAKGGETKMDGIDALAKSLNRVTKHENDLRIVLENTTHAKLSVGSDIDDFYHVLQKLDFPERVSFCVDTCHAFAYGYNLLTPEGRDDFIELLDQKIGLDKIVLIHLNDSAKKCGSKIDRHAMVGAGAIGTENLRSFVNHEKLNHIPLMMELPVACEDDEVGALEVVRSW